MLCPVGVAGQKTDYVQNTGNSTGILRKISKAVSKTRSIPRFLQQQTGLLEDEQRKA